jgi:hypothetical protein
MCDRCALCGRLMFPPSDAVLVPDNQGRVQRWHLMCRDQVLFEPHVDGATAIREMRSGASDEPHDSASEVETIPAESWEIGPNHSRHSESGELR